MDLSKYQAKLNKAALDPCSSFLSGNATSLFGGLPVTASGLQEFKDSIMTPEEIKQLGIQITSDFVGNVTQHAASYIATKAAELLTPPSIGDVASLAAQELGSLLVTPAQLLKELMSDTESLLASERDAAIAKGLSEANSKIGGKIAMAREKIQKVLGPVQEHVGNIMSYMQQGPKWVQEQVTRVENDVNNQVDSLVETYMDEARKFKAEQLKNLSKMLAKKNADGTNESLTDQVRQKLVKVEQAKTQAMVWVKAQVRAGLLAVKAMLGM